MTRTAPVPFVVFVCLAAACGPKADPEPPVAVPALTLDRAAVPLGTPLEATYRFRVVDAARIDGDYRVMVHFVDADRDLMWTDDHDPPVPTSAWKTGELIEYARTVFVPNYPYIGEASIRMGLYDPDTGRRLPLEGENRGQRAYDVGAVRLLPQSEGVFLSLREGWHDLEYSTGVTPRMEWQWTAKEAHATFRNPRRDVVLYFEADGRPDLFGRPQEVTVTVAGQPVETFPVDGTPELRRIPVAAARLGDADVVDLTIAVDRAFVPASVPGGNEADGRELGIRVLRAQIAAR